MAQQSEWRSLRLNEAPSPVLYIRFRRSPTSYHCTLTDLTNVWEERLDQPGIVHRAEARGCPINASEDRQQLQILVEKIAEAFLSVNGASVRIVNGTDESLEFETRSILPEPLPALKWQLLLAKQESKVLTSQIVCPLLLSLQAKRHALEDLRSQIRDKDHVISRLLDRLESSGTDLTTVFPGTSNVKLSRKLAQRTQLAKYVKGLQPFELEKWRPIAASLPSTYHLLDDVEHCDSTNIDSILQSLGSSDGSWWLHGDLNKAKPAESQVQYDVPEEQPQPEDDETEDEDFQVQQIPNSSALSSRVPPSPEAIHARDLSNTDIEPEHSHRIPSRTLSDGRSKRFGVIGGVKTKPEPPASVGLPISSPRMEKAPMDDTSAIAKPKGTMKMGTIGGRRRQRSVESNREFPGLPNLATQASDRVSEPRNIASYPRGRSVPSAANDRQRPEEMANKSSSPPAGPRESSQERANRRREELKRQVGNEASKPIKKKRRF